MCRSADGDRVLGTAAPLPPGRATAAETTRRGPGPAGPGPAGPGARWAAAAGETGTGSGDRDDGCPTLMTVGVCEIDPGVA